MEVGNKSKQRFEELHLASKHGSLGNANTTKILLGRKN